MRVQHLQGLGLQLCEGRSIRRDNINLFFFFFIESLEKIAAYFTTHLEWTITVHVFAHVEPSFCF